MNFGEAFLTSKDSGKQEILNYMAYHGVQIRKYQNVYYLDASDVRNVNKFAELTNYHGVIGHNMVHIKKNPLGGRSENVFGTLEDAYEALKYLYDIMTSTKSDMDF